MLDFMLKTYDSHRGPKTVACRANVKWVVCDWDSGDMVSAADTYDSAELLRERLMANLPDIPRPYIRPLREA